MYQTGLGSYSMIIVRISQIANMSMRIRIIDPQYRSSELLVHLNYSEVSSDEDLIVNLYPSLECLPSEELDKTVIVTKILPSEKVIDIFKAGCLEYLSDDSSPYVIAAAIRNSYRRINKREEKNIFASNEVILLKNEKKVLTLSVVERKIITELLNNKGRVVPKENLKELVKSNIDITGIRTFDNIMFKLKKKVEISDAGLSITTLYGSGYILNKK